jgi:hypothetical protein
MNAALLVAGVLREAPRQGSSEDKPEGTQYITISDTLALQLAEILENASRCRSCETELVEADMICNHCRK